MRFTLLFFAIIFLVSSCQNEKGGLTSSGMKYVVHTSGDNPKPQPGDYVHFHAQMRNGEKVVYASRSQGDPPFLQISKATVTGRKPSPVEDVLREMGIGDSVTLFIPIDTLDPKPTGFEDTDFMLYDVVCLDIQSEEIFKEQYRKRQEGESVMQNAVRARAPEVAKAAIELTAKYMAGELQGQLQTTPSGLKYIIHEEGQGAQAIPGKLVNVHYYGLLTDGAMFDNSFQRGSSISFPLGQGRVIPGWDEGIAVLKEGGKATFFIPQELGYGETGSPPRIPPNAELVFYVELVKVN